MLREGVSSLVEYQFAFAGCIAVRCSGVQKGQNAYNYAGPYERAGSQLPEASAPATGKPNGSQSKASRQDRKGHLTTHELATPVMREGSDGTCAMGKTLWSPILSQPGLCLRLGYEVLLRGHTLLEARYTCLNWLSHKKVPDSMLCSLNNTCINAGQLNRHSLWLLLLLHLYYTQGLLHQGQWEIA